MIMDKLNKMLFKNNTQLNIKKMNQHLGTQSERLRIPWLYPPWREGSTTSPVKGVLIKIINFICCWDPSPWDLRSVENSFIIITSRSTISRSSSTF